MVIFLLRCCWRNDKKEKRKDLLEPVWVDNSWRARDTDAFNITQFQIDWDKEQVTYPMGKFSNTWFLSKGDLENQSSRFILAPKIACLAQPGKSPPIAHLPHAVWVFRPKNCISHYGSS